MKTRNDIAQIAGVSLLLSSLLMLSPPYMARAQHDDGETITAGDGAGPIIRSTDGGRTWFVVEDAVEGKGGRTLARALDHPSGTLALDVWITGGMLRAAFTLDRPGEVTVRIIDMTGRVVAMWHEGSLAAGDRTTMISIDHLPGGCYYYSMICNGRIGGARILID